MWEVTLHFLQYFFISQWDQKIKMRYSNIFEQDILDVMETEKYGYKQYWYLITTCCLEKFSICIWLWLAEVKNVICNSLAYRLWFQILFWNAEHLLLKAFLTKLNNADILVVKASFRNIKAVSLIHLNVLKCAKLLQQGCRIWV